MLAIETSHDSRPGHGTTPPPAPGTSREASGTSSYLNVFIDFDEGVRDLFPVTADGLRPVRVFAHALGDPDRMRTRFRRVHENVLYELPLV